MTGKTETNERAVSEILGTVLLISLVLVGSATVVVFGASVITDAQEQTRSEAAADYLQQVDSQLATLSASADEPEVRFDPQDAAAREYDIQRDGHFNVTINAGSGSACSFEQQLSTLEYEDTNGNSVGYEAGGVWRGDGEGSIQVTAPDVTFTNGRLSANLVNVSGTFDQSRNRVELNVTRTRNTTRTFRNELLQNDCTRPDNVTVEVRSQFYRGWADYLESETGVTPDEFASNQTARVKIPQHKLHPSANDEENQVINLRDPPDMASYMDEVDLTEAKPPEMMVNKSASNNYTTFVGPVANDSLDIGERIDVEGTTVPAPPKDVSLIIDESGSMDDTPVGSTQRKIDAAKAEARNFLGYINETRDRANVISYNGDAYYRRVNGNYFSGDFDEVNDTINTTIHQGGSTRIDKGLDYSNSAFDLRGNETRDKVTILLTDGRNNAYCGGCNPNRLTEEAAQQADNDSIQVFTIGFGDPSNVNETLLKYVANATGGTYYQASSASDLQDAYENISDEVNRQPKSAYANMPITTNVTSVTGSQFSPEIPGNVSHIANNSNGLLNVNDPTAPSLFSHSFEIGDGEEFALNVTNYDCADGAYNLTGQSVTVGGNTRPVARCTDIVSGNESFKGYIYHDGDSVPQLTQTDYEDWQTNLTKALNSDRYPSTRIESGTLNTTSNQALVVYDLPPQGPNTRNTMALLVRVGLAESDAQGTGIVTVRVSEAEVS